MLNYSFKTFVSFLFLLALSCPLVAQNETFKFFTVEDGLSQSQVHCILQDSRGYLWFGTDAGGLCRYDGRTFTVFGTTDGLADNKVFSLCEDAKGNIWAGTSKGISIYNGQQFITTPPEFENLKRQSVAAIAFDNKGYALIGTNSGLFIWDGTRLILNSVVCKPIRSIFKDHNENIWVGSGMRGIYQFTNSRIKNYTTADGLQSDSVWAIMEPVKGELWVGTDKGVSQLKISNRKIEYKENLNIPYVRAFLTDNNNNKLVLTDGHGIFKINNEGCRQITTKQGLSTDIIWSGLCDREGNLWFGTDGSGVIKYQFSPFSRLSDQDGLYGNIVLSILHDSKGNEWYGTEKGATEVITDKSTGVKKFIYFFGEKGKYPGERIWSIIEDKKGNIWFTTLKNGIYKYDGNSFTNYTKKDGLAEDYVRSLIADNDGNIWVGTVSGLNRLDKGQGKKFKLYGKKNGMPNNAAMSIFKDSKGGIWFATNGGICKYDPSGNEQHQFISITEKNGLPSDGLLSIAEDSDGNIWCAGFNGISKVDIKNKTCKNLGIKEGLTSSSIYVLVADKKGSLFVGSNKGIDKINIAKFNRTGKLDVKHYGKEEGFSGMECNTNSYFRDDDGSIWFGSINGAIRYDPSHDQSNTAEPITHITGINLFFEKFNWSPYSLSNNEQTGLPENLKLPYNKNHLTFNCIALSLTIPEKTVYSYKMDGFDQQWSPPTKQPFATYSYLPPGKYTFMVKAMNSDGIWSKTPATFSFSISPPFWQTWWFYLITIIFLILSLALFFRVRLQSLEKRAIELQQRVDVKTMELRKEKEIVESQHKIIEKKNQNITASINYAQRIQRTVLPIKENIQKLFPQSFILLRPKDIVSGDFYWFTEIGSKIIVAAVDCTGHGIPGAFMSLIGNNLMNNVVINNEITGPSQILYRLHEEIIVTLKKSEQNSATVDGMDISLCMIDKTTNVLEFASTGQPLILIRNGKSEVIKSGKYPLGLILKKERQYETQTFQLQKNDALYLFTDGFIDQFGTNNDEKFSEGRLNKLLSEIQHQDMKEQEIILEKAYNNWKGDLPQLDDTLVIGIKI